MKTLPLLRMIRRTLLLTLVVFLVAFPANAAQPGTPAPARTVASKPPSADSTLLSHLLDSLVIPGLERQHIPGMVIVVVHDSDIVLAKGYGFADLEHRIPFDPDRTVMRIASVSKLFTGTAVLQLVDRQLLDMHQDVNRYLTRFKVPEWPGRPITLTHLLTHTAGFDDGNIGKSAWTQESQIPLGDYLAARLPARLCPPGEVYTYSNFSNALAGFVVEEVAHVDFATYVRRNILEPLGMEHSDYRLRPDLQPLLSQCYAHAGAGVQHAPFDFINDYPGGQMLSTGSDMARFMMAHLRGGVYGGKRILSEESVLAMHTVQFTHGRDLVGGVGYSFSILPARSSTVIMHDGGYIGIRSRLCLCPEYRFGFFIACNILDDPLINDVSRTLLDRCIPPAPRDSMEYPLTVIPRFDGNIADFAGTYRYSRYSHTSVEKVGILLGLAGFEIPIEKNREGMILMRTFSGKPRRMVQVQPCVFRSIDDNYSCAFRRDETGAITHFFPDGTAAFERLAWYETIAVQRFLFGSCVLFFSIVAVVLPIIRWIRRVPRLPKSGATPIRRLAVATAATFLLYPLGMAAVVVLVIPRSELEMGLLHGLHWSMYAAQTIPILGMCSIVALLVMLVRNYAARGGLGFGGWIRSVALGVTTSIVGVAFLWILSYWNLVGYRF